MSISAPWVVLLHVHHMMGIGHLRRAVMLGVAMAKLGMRVHIASGGMPVPGLRLGELGPGALCVHQLPPARAADLSYKSLVDEDGNPVDDEWHARRRAALSALVEAVVPHALITETYPFGRRRLCGEYEHLIKKVRQVRPGALVASSVRDILDGFPGPPGRVETVLATVELHYQTVFVHGDPAVVPLDESFPVDEALARKLVYTGYVSSRPVSVGAENDGLGEVLVSTGGGVVGQGLVRAAAAARALSAVLGERTWRILVGHNLPEADFQALRMASPPGVIVQRNRTDFYTLLRNCAVSISQVGYNTSVDILQAGARAVVVPFASDTQLEQQRRAQLLHARALAVAIAPHELSPARLAAAVDEAALALSPADRSGLADIGLAGAERTARLLAGLLCERG
ncbi:MAG: glycosyl transferase [Gammaproteobacteria bacterium]|nr:glycosyl transferase [Gammaproteobacteria bacterium]